MFVTAELQATLKQNLLAVQRFISALKLTCLYQMFHKLPLSNSQLNSITL
jgi:hypothetical protein